MTLNNITDLKVTQIRIFPVDIVPLTRITTKSYIDKIRDKLLIREIEMRPSIEGKDTIAFIRGELKKTNKLIIINKIEVDPRRIILEVEGTSEDGEEIYSTFLTIIKDKQDVNSNSLKAPLLIVESTQCVTTLDFTFDKLFSTVFNNFLNKHIEKAATKEKIKATVRPLTFSAEINYDVEDRTILDNKITMNPKQFTITPRPGAPAETKKFIISSPFNSDIHFKLINYLNKAIKSSK